MILATLSRPFTKTNLYAVIIFVIVIVGLQVLLTALKVPSYLLPTPSEVGYVLVNPPVNIFANLAVTLYEIVVGFVIALVLATGLAVITGLSDFIRRVLYPYVLMVHLAPKVAIAPLLIIWFGFGLEPKIIMTFLIAFFPMFIDTATGLNAIQPDTLNVVRALGFTKWQIMQKVRIPNALPFIFSGMKTGITLAVVGAVIVELISSNIGVGYLLLQGMIGSDTPLIFAMLILISIVGMALFAVIVIAENLAIPWYILPRKQYGREEG